MFVDDLVLLFQDQLNPRMRSSMPIKHLASLAIIFGTLVSALPNIPRASPVLRGPTISDFSVCGNYCGPGWCNGQWLHEENCDDSIAPETWTLSGPSCADQCCQAHDRCCGTSHGPWQDCNRQIVDCLGRCNPLSATCTLDGVPVPAGGIWAAMDLVEVLSPCHLRVFRVFCLCVAV